MAGKRASCAHQMSVARLGDEGFLITRVRARKYIIALRCIEGGRAPLIIGSGRARRARAQ